jgi:hypothetical protein
MPGIGILDFYLSRPGILEYLEEQIIYVETVWDTNALSNVVLT